MLHAICSSNQFKCNSGDCIKEDAVCDGHTDCRDKSDETAKICSGFQCPAYTFRCSYGACINENEKCNGRIDCADGSDENPTLCGSNTVSPSVMLVTVKPVTINPTS